MNGPHFRAFDVNGGFVLLMERGAGNEEDTRLVEQSTTQDGVFLSIKFSLPWAKADKYFETYDQDSAERFFTACREQLDELSALEEQK